MIFGLWMAAQARRSRSKINSPDRHWLSAPFFQTLALTLVNPLGVVVFMGFVVQLPAAPSLSAVVFLCLCVFAGSLLVQLGLAVSGSLVARLTEHTGWLRALNFASGVGVATFGVVGLLPLLQSA